MFKATKIQIIFKFSQIRMLYAFLLERMHLVPEHNSNSTRKGKMEHETGLKELMLVWHYS